MKKPAKIVVVSDFDPVMGINTLFAEMPVRRGSVLYMRKSLYLNNKDKYEGIPTEGLE